MAWRSGQSYSADLRQWVLASVDKGTPVRLVPELFDVSISFIYKALGRRRATGETTARVQGNRQRLKLAAYHDVILAEVERQPDVTLAELRGWLVKTHGIEASIGLMHKTMTRLGLTLKNVRTGGGAEARRRRRAACRLAHRTERHERQAADLHRRNRRIDQDGPASWPLPARHAARYFAAARPLEDDDLRRRADKRRLHRTLRPRRRHRRRRFQSLDGTDAGAASPTWRHRGDG